MKKPEFDPNFLLCLMGFSFAASVSVVSPILSIYLNGPAAVSLGMIGVVTSAFFISSALTKMLLGVVVGGKMTIVFLLPAFVLLSIIATLYPLTSDTAVLVLLRILQGISYAFILTISMILAVLTFPTAERDKGIGKYAVSVSLGTLTGPAVTSVTIPIVGISNTFYFSSILGVIGIFGAYFMIRKILPIEREWQIVGIKVEKTLLGEKLRAIVHDKMFQMAFFSNLASFAFLGIVLAYAPLYAKTKLGINYATFSVLYLLFCVSSAIFRIGLGRILSKIKKKFLMIMVLGLGIIVSILFAITTSSVVFATAFMLLGIVQGAVYPIGSMVIAEYIESSKNVLASSIYAIGLDIGQGLAPLIVGTTLISLGLDNVFALATAIPIVATVYIALLISLPKMWHA